MKRWDVPSRTVSKSEEEAHDCNNPSVQLQRVVEGRGPTNESDIDVFENSVENGDTSESERRISPVSPSMSSNIPINRMDNVQ